MRPGLSRLKNPADRCGTMTFDSVGYGAPIVGSDYQLGEWVVRPQRDCIERGGETVHLKPKAMAVLACLLRADGGVVERTELLYDLIPLKDYVL